MEKTSLKRSWRKKENPCTKERFERQELATVDVTEIRKIGHVSVKAYISLFKTKVSILLLLMIILLLFSSLITSTSRKC
ncbi:putative multidrug resistance-associated protein lethal(2)03659 isoform X1 [Vespula squamosa]|uniref:Multidrug resistance-associated protein lethal(2)03659 isoform X1 n=1 Tax=Vespula squamosa TaxID=30214 RepID=A0ABD1ZUT0_VESSQ